MLSQYIAISSLPTILYANVFEKMIEHVWIFLYPVIKDKKLQ